MKALLILFITAIALLFAGLHSKRKVLQFLGLAGTLGALIFTLTDLWYGDSSGLNNRFGSMMQFDSYALAFGAVLLVTTLLLIGLTGWGFRQLSDTLGDNYGLLFFSVCGGLCMVSFTNLVMLFLGIEILSIPLYVLAGSRRDEAAPNEAALKYFLMGSFATGFLLFGMALIYGGTGSFDVAAIGEVLRSGTFSKPLIQVGLLLLMVGMGFKVSVVPFHFWAPDVYTGSPDLVTAFMSTVVKTAAFAGFYRLFAGAFPGIEGMWAPVIAVIAGLTMTISNFTAIFQTDFKRMMAYSSISHAGYLLLAILCLGQAGSSGAMLLYALGYGIATVSVFAIYLLVSEQSGDASIEAFNGLSKREPLMAALMAVSMFSLAGIPPTVGFFGKYFLFAGALHEYPWLIVLAVINSAVSIYYYFKVIIAMYFRRTDAEPEVLLPVGFRWVALGCLGLMVGLTIAPDWIQKML
jgi:NADH-quinone oxidoreductase subunit N